MLTEKQLRTMFNHTNFSGLRNENWTTFKRLARRIEEMTKSEQHINEPIKMADETITYPEVILTEKAWNYKRITDLILFLGEAVKQDQSALKQYKPAFNELQRLLNTEL